MEREIESLDRRFKELNFVQRVPVLALVGFGWLKGKIVDALRAKGAG